MINSLLGSFSSEHLPELTSIVEEFLEKQGSERELLSSMLYSLEAGGKRLRPLLVLGTLAFFSQKIEKGAYQVAGALEMIHTYSLIHDDLPAMDNDELRRGKPTNHMVYGEGLAILAGDGLLTEAFNLVAQGEVSLKDKVSIIQKLASAAGTQGMIGGQVADIKGETQNLNLAELESVHQRKTGALIKFAVEVGLLLSNQDQRTTELMMIYGEHFGIAFQIKDDLLDVIGDEAVIGKKTGMDQILNKSTYTSLLGVEGAQKALEVHYQKALSALLTVKEGLSKPRSVTVLEELLNTLMV